MPQPVKSAPAESLPVHGLTEFDLLHLTGLLDQGAAGAAHHKAPVFQRGAPDGADVPDVAPEVNLQDTASYRDEGAQTVDDEQLAHMIRVVWFADYMICSLYVDSTHWVLVCSMREGFFMCYIFL